MVRRRKELWTPALAMKNMRERERVRAGHRSGTVRSQINVLDLNIEYRFGILI
jgi:hypothetical protein